MTPEEKEDWLGELAWHLEAYGADCSYEDLCQAYRDAGGPFD